MASELLTAQWTHHPRPGVTVHTRPARLVATSATAVITNGTTDSTVAVTWEDGAAATRQCHTDYTLVYGYKDAWTGPYVYELPPPTVTVDTTAIVIANTWRIMSNAGPYARRIPVHSDRVWEEWTAEGWIPDMKIEEGGPPRGERWIGSVSPRGGCNLQRRWTPLAGRPSSGSKSSDRDKTY